MKKTGMAIGGPVGGATISSEHQTHVVRISDPWQHAVLAQHTNTVKSDTVAYAAVMFAAGDKEFTFWRPVGTTDAEMIQTLATVYRDRATNKDHPASLLRAASEDAVTLLKSIKYEQITGNQAVVKTQVMVNLENAIAAASRACIDRATSVEPLK